MLHSNVKTLYPNIFKEAEVKHFLKVHVYIQVDYLSCVSSIEHLYVHERHKIMFQNCQWKPGILGTRQAKVEFLLI